MALLPDPAAPTARAHTVKGRATRERIIAAAAELIHRNGVAGTRLDEVGVAAAVGRSQMYHYFADKAELVSAVIDYQTDRVLQVGDLGTWAGWRAWRDGVVAHYAERDCGGGCPLGSLVSELSGEDPAAARSVSTSFKRWEQAFRAGVDQLQRAGRLGPEADPGALARTVLIALEGGLLLSNAHREVSYLELALDNALDGLRARATTAPGL